jgi:hypothetical protein
MPGGHYEVVFGAGASGFLFCSQPTSSESEQTASTTANTLNFQFIRNSFAQTNYADESSDSKTTWNPSQGLAETEFRGLSGVAGTTVKTGPGGTIAQL